MSCQSRNRANLTLYVWRQYDYYGGLTRFDPATGNPNTEQHETSLECGYSAQEEKFELDPIKIHGTFIDPVLDKNVGVEESKSKIEQKTRTFFQQQEVKVKPNPKREKEKKEEKETSKPPTGHTPKPPTVPVHYRFTCFDYFEKYIAPKWCPYGLDKSVPGQNYCFAKKESCAFSIKKNDKCHFRVSGQVCSCTFVCKPKPSDITPNGPKKKR